LRPGYAADETAATLSGIVPPIIHTPVAASYNLSPYFCPFNVKNAKKQMRDIILATTLLLGVLPASAAV
jgi:hypothetical protein